MPILIISDDNLISYSTIWDGEVTSTGDSDHKRVITAMKNISEGINLERYMDIDNLVNYMAVHIFSENEDSLSGNMAHNYYLYESNGQLNILPWDYNLIFGGMGTGHSSGATDTINGAIDNAWTSTTFFDTLLADGEYHAAYYSAMKQVVHYIQNGSFDAFYSRVRNQIDTLVETDPNAFYTYEEYLLAAETLYEVVTLRGQSIQGQLDGSIPSTDTERRSSDVLVDASHIDLSIMGCMNVGGGGFPLDGRSKEHGNPMQTTSSSSPSPLDNSREPPEGVAPSRFGSQMSEKISEHDQMQPEQGKSELINRPGMNFSNQSSDMSDTFFNYSISAIVMLTAFLFALFYHPKPRNR